MGRRIWLGQGSVADEVSRSQHAWRAEIAAELRKPRWFRGWITGAGSNTPLIPHHPAAPSVAK